jgi:hypothetical protein
MSHPVPHQSTLVFARIRSVSNWRECADGAEETIDGLEVNYIVAAALSLEG